MDDQWAVVYDTYDNRRRPIVIGRIVKMLEPHGIELDRMYNVGLQAFCTPDLLLPWCSDSSDKRIIYEIINRDDADSIMAMYALSGGDHR